MDQPVSNAHSFIVKVWLEETADEAGQAVWRGLVTHVPSGARRYIKHLDDLVAFIIPYLREMGVTLDLRSRLRYWLKTHCDLL